MHTSMTEQPTSSLHLTPCALLLATLLIMAGGILPAGERATGDSLADPATSIMPDRSRMRAPALVEIPPPDPVRLPVGQVQQARDRGAGALLEAARWYEETGSDKAREAYLLLIAAFPGTPRALEARFAVGRLLAETSPMEAFRWIESSFPPRPDPKKVESRLKYQYNIGRTMMALGAREVTLPWQSAPGGGPVTGYMAAATIFAAVEHTDPNGRYAAAAVLGVAEACARLDRPDIAELYYRRVIDAYSASRFVAQARTGLGKLLASRSEDGGGQVSRRALEDLLLPGENGGGTEEAPVDAEAGKVLAADAERRARKRYDKAESYGRLAGDRARASLVFQLREIIRRYPATEAAGMARDDLAGMGEPVPEGMRAEAAGAGGDRVGPRLAGPKLAGPDLAPEPELP